MPRKRRRRARRRAREDSLEAITWIWTTLEMTRVTTNSALLRSLKWMEQVIWDQLMVVCERMVTVAVQA